jgi:hypothetical protein
MVGDLKKLARHDEGLRAEDVDANVAIQSCLRLGHDQVKHQARIELQLPEGLPRSRETCKRSSRCE